MSALPDKQPLTRRQARASERSRQPEASAHYPSSSYDAAAPEHGDQPERPEQAHESEPVGAADEAARAEAEAEADRAAWAPPPTGSAPLRERPAREPEPEPEADLELLDAMPERTLTRRELRALLAAQAAQRADADGSTPGEDNAESAEPAAVGDDDTAPVAAAILPQPPIGHWSLDIDVEDDADDQGFDQVLSRGVGAGGVPTTTNALILPMIPQQSGDVTAVRAGSEMLVTGSIDLPSLGDTGAHPHRIDSPEVDRLLEQVDDASPSTSAQPVRASKAVSTHTSTRDTLTPPKQGGVNIPTILAITAAVLALGVIGLFIGGYIFNIF